MQIIYYIVALIAPAAMLLVGLLWHISPPPYQKKGLAYNTELTRKNPDAWAVAHRHCSRLWIRIGIISSGASIILMVLFSDVYASFWLWLIVGQMVLFCVSVFMIDLFLKTSFSDEDDENADSDKESSSPK